ncbi:MAG: hydroxymethylglutaryl-CoA lyase [Desulfobacterales bacterium]|jgi:hydroxymethylglutaryl-CoA lyase
MPETEIFKQTVASPYPDEVTLIEVGPRDGFQFESKIIPTPIKVAIISALVAAGLKRIQVASFVHPRRVPQMADAEVLLQTLPAWADVVLSGLVLNRAGLERARLTRLRQVEISISASDTHSRRNTGMPLAEAFYRGPEMVRLARKYGLQVRAGIQCAFGCVYEGAIPVKRVVDMARAFVDQGAAALALADTTGMADPLSIRRMVGELEAAVAPTPVILHLHDTRGLGLVNLMAALECGITRFDTALAGMGGCPFVAGAAGNIATEDTVYLLDRLQVNTGISIKDVAACSIRLENFFGKKFAGKMHRLAL